MGIWRLDRPVLSYVAGLQYPGDHLECSRLAGQFIARQVGVMPRLRLQRAGQACRNALAEFCLGCQQPFPMIRQEAADEFCAGDVWWAVRRVVPR